MQNFRLSFTSLAILILLSCQKTSQSSNRITTSTEDDQSLSIDTSFITKDLVAYYPFNNNLLDYSNNNHNGTAIGTASYMNDHSGKAKSALKLGSVRVVTDNFFHFQRTDSFTVTTWFRLRTNNSGGRLMSSECPEGNFRIAAYSNGIYAVQFGSYYAYDTIKLDHWYYLTYTYKKKNVKLYRDATLLFSGIDNGTESITDCAPFTIGAKASSAYDMWQGAIDDLRIYSTVLKPNQINYLYKH